MSIPQITERELSDLLSLHPIVVIHLDAAWNGHRVSMRAEIQHAAEVFGNSAWFGEVDVDAEMDLARSLKLANVPSVAYFRDGRLVEVRVGLKQGVIERVELLLYQG